MGKSEKISRAKKEKIYQLRKKYDDFLEDDKKRKDRNVYILERLERMRSCVATLQINQKGIVSGQNNLRTENQVSANNPPISNNNRMLMRRDVINYRENSWDDNNILKEISKKYILIPKIHTITPTSSVTYPVMDLDSNEFDWKHKYNILEELKRNEKVEPPERDIDTNSLQRDSDILYKAEKDMSIPPTSQDSNILNKHDIIGVECTNDTQIRSKSPSAVVNIDTSKFNNNNDREKSQFLSHNINEELDTVIATKKLTISNNTNSDSSVKKKNSSINNVRSKTHGEINDLKIDENKNGSKDAIETESVFNQEMDKQGTGIEKEHIIDKTVQVKKPNSENIPENKQEDIAKNISHEIKTDYNEPKNIEIVSEDYVQNNHIENTKEIKTNVVPNSDECNENEMQVNEVETKQNEIAYSEDSKQLIADNQMYEQPEMYSNDNNYANSEYTYYEGSELQQVHDAQYTNVNNDNHETIANYDENHGQHYENDYSNEYTNQYENQTFENYQTDNNYEQNPNYEYQETSQENTEYLNTENYVPSEPTQNILEETNLDNSEQQYYNEPYIGETQSQQEIYQHVEQNQDEIQQQINVEGNYVENQENYVEDQHNIIGDESEANPGTENEMLTVEHEYVAENYEENQHQQNLNAENNYVVSEENNIGEENTTLNNEILSMQRDIFQSNDDNQQQQYVEGYQESPGNIEAN